MFIVQEKTTEREIFRIQKEKAERGRKEITHTCEVVSSDRTKAYTMPETWDAFEDSVRTEAKKNNLVTSVFSFK